MSFTRTSSSISIYSSSPTVTPHDGFVRETPVPVTGLSPKQLGAISAAEMQNQSAEALAAALEVLRLKYNTLLAECQSMKATLRAQSGGKLWSNHGNSDLDAAVYLPAPSVNGYDLFSTKQTTQERHGLNGLDSFPLALGSEADVEDDNYVQMLLTPRDSTPSRVSAMTAASEYVQTSPNFDDRLAELVTKHRQFVVNNAQLHEQLEKVTRQLTDLQCKNEELKGTNDRLQRENDELRRIQDFLKLPAGVQVVSPTATGGGVVEASVVGDAQQTVMLQRPDGVCISTEEFTSSVSEDLRAAITFAMQQRDEIKILHDTVNQQNEQMKQLLAKLERQDSASKTGAGAERGLAQPGHDARSVTASSSPQRPKAQPNSNDSVHDLQSTTMSRLLLDNFGLKEQNSAMETSSELLAMGEVSRPQTHIADNLAQEYPTLTQATQERTTQDTLLQSQILQARPNQGHLNQSQSAQRYATKSQQVQEYIATASEYTPPNTDEYFGARRLMQDNDVNVRLPQVNLEHRTRPGLVFDDDIYLNNAVLVRRPPDIDGVLRVTGIPADTRPILGGFRPVNSISPSVPIAVPPRLNTTGGLDFRRDVFPPFPDVNITTDMPFDGTMPPESYVDITSARPPPLPTRTYRSSTSEMVNRTMPPVDSEPCCPVCGAARRSIAASDAQFERHVSDCLQATAAPYPSLAHNTRVCPLCNTEFSSDIPQRDFEMHVQQHFEEPNIVQRFEVL